MRRKNTEKREYMISVSNKKCLNTLFYHKGMCLHTTEHLRYLYKFSVKKTSTADCINRTLLYHIENESYLTTI